MGETLAPSLEDRVRDLEGTRITIIAHVNACQTLLIGVWANVIPKLQGDPIEIAETFRSAWLEAAETPAGDFPGIDPATLDVIGQEYRDAIDVLSGHLVDYLRGQAPKGGEGEHEADP